MCTDDVDDMEAPPDLSEAEVVLLEDEYYDDDVDNDQEEDMMMPPESLLQVGSGLIVVVSIVTIRDTTSLSLKGFTYVCPVYEMTYLLLSCLLHRHNMLSFEWSNY